MPSGSRQITIYTGSFKPPHKGHLSLVKKMLEQTNKTRTGNKGPGYVYIFISNKPREPCSKINGKISKEIWKEYLTTLPEKDRIRVRLVLSQLRSPILTAYGFAKKVAAPGDIFYLIKSTKNAQNTRYSSFRSLKNHQILYKELILPGFENLNSTDMRKIIKQGLKKDFLKFIPDKLSVQQKDNLWKKLRKLC